MANNVSGVQAHFSTNNPAIIFQLVWPEKAKFWYLERCTFFQKIYLFRGRHARWLLPKLQGSFHSKPKLTMNNEPPASGQSYEACLSIDKLSIKHNCNRCQMLYNSYHTLGTHWHLGSIPTSLLKKYNTYAYFDRTARQNAWKNQLLRGSG